MTIARHGVLREGSYYGILTDRARFGSGEALLAMTEKIVKREGSGHPGAGAERAAKKIGRGAERFALTVKNRNPMHEPRGAGPPWPMPRRRPRTTCEP
jgi:aldehyde:ferredoxin oxidoreductase